MVTIFFSFLYKTKKKRHNQFDAYIPYVYFHINFNAYVTLKNFKKREISEDQMKFQESGV